MRDAVKLAIAIGFAIGCGDSKTAMPPPGEPPEMEPGPPLADVTAISVGGDHACAVLTGGAVGCWGQNHFEQIGPAAVAGDYSARPLLVTGLPAMVSVAAGKAHLRDALSGEHGLEAAHHGFDFGKLWHVLLLDQFEGTAKSLLNRLR